MRLEEERAVEEKERNAEDARVSATAMTREASVDRMVFASSDEIGKFLILILSYAQFDRLTSCFVQLAAQKIARARLQREADALVRIF